MPRPQRRFGGVSQDPRERGPRPPKTDLEPDLAELPLRGDFGGLAPLGKSRDFPGFPGGGPACTFSRVFNNSPIRDRWSNKTVLDVFFCVQIRAKSRFGGGFCPPAGPPPGPPKTPVLEPPVQRPTFRLNRRKSPKSVILGVFRGYFGVISGAFWGNSGGIFGVFSGYFEKEVRVFSEYFLGVLKSRSGIFKKKVFRRLCLEGRSSQKNALNVVLRAAAKESCPV